MKIKFLLLGTSLSFIPLTVNAQCVETTNCETLGYTETTCNGGKGVKCPFGNKWACLGANEEECMKIACEKLNFKYSCSGTGYAGGAGTACNGKYTQCTCASGYEWKNGACQQKAPDYSACQIGTLFYSDGTCSYDKLSSKKLLGVVVYEKTASESGWVMTVKPIATGITWGIFGITTGITDKAASASCTNTQKLVALGSRYEAAIAANNYTAGGKQWCLPSYDVLNNINNSTNFTKVNAGILTAEGTILGNISSGIESGYEFVWSSSEGSGESTWAFDANTKGDFKISNYHKDGPGSYGSVRPVFAF